MEPEEKEGTEPRKLTRKERRAAKKAEKKAKVRAMRAERAKKVKLFPADKKGYHVMHYMNLLRTLFYPVHFLVYPYKLHGKKKVGKGACIFVGNHYCIWDVFYPARTTREGIHYLAKQSIMEAPVVGYWAYRVGAIGAMRDGADVRTLMEAIRVLRNGEKISLFPEGTRNKGTGDEFLPFHGGAALMSIKTKTPIVPFVICNRPRIWHVTHVMFGEPFEFTDYYDKKLTAEDYERADEELVQRLYALREEWRASRKKGEKKDGKE